MRLRMHGPPLGRRALGSAALLAALAAIPVPAAAQPGPPSSRPATRTETPFTVEYYYKAKWGFADEFARLFKKNHLPVLKKQLFPDQETYRREEQRRFEILLAHWDLPLVAAPEMAP